MCNLVMGAFCYSIQLFPNHPIYLVGHTALGAQWRVTWSLHLPYMTGRSLLFQVWCHQMMLLILNLWWALNLVILVWWLGIRLMCLLAPGLQVRCHLNPTFPWNQGVRIMGFLDQAVADFKQGLDSILTDSLETLALDTSLDEPDAIMSSSVSAGFLSTQFVPLLIILSHSFLPSIWTRKLWCQAMALLAPLSLATKMSASKLIHYFSSHPAAFRFWASTPPDNISLNSANRKADQSLKFSDWGWWHCTCYSWHRATHFLSQGCPCWYSFLTGQGWGRCYTCDWSVWITFSISMTFWKRLFPSKLEIQHVILAHLFNSVSREHREDWASQFPFFHSLKPSKACLHGCINWSLAQANSVGLSKVFSSYEGWQGHTTDWVPIHSTEETCVRVCARDMWGIFA